MKLSQFKLALNILRKSTQVELPREDAYYQTLHAKIMKGVQKEDIFSKIRFLMPEAQWVKNVAASVVAVTTALTLWSFLKPLDDSNIFKYGKFNIDKKDTEHFTDTMVSFGEDDDFLFDIASSRMNELDAEQVNELLNKLSN